MARVFTEPKTLREVLTCKSKWYKGAMHHLLFEHLDTINPYNVPLVQRYYSHCLMGAVECTEPSPADTNELGTSENSLKRVIATRNRSKRRDVILSTIQKLCEQRKLPLREYYSVERFNDHHTTEWKHIQLLLRHLPKGV